MDESILTQKYLKEAMSYDPETGIFMWKDRPFHHFSCEKGRNISRAKALGKRAGSQHKDGYWRVTLLKRNFLMHRLAFLYMEGAFPTDCVDHVNHDRTDNRWSNLRHSTVWDNARNASMFRHNSSGYPGIRLDSKSGIWHAYINNNKKKRVNLGSFTNQGDALIARKAAERALGYHANHGKGLQVMRHEDLPEME